MERDAVERMVRVIGEDYQVARVAAALTADCPYEEVFKLVPCYGSSERWHAPARIHKMVVAAHPTKAHEWLTIAIKPLLLPPEANHAFAYFMGTILGLLEAGIWLDEEWKKPTEFQEQLLLTLAKVICSPVKLDLHARHLDARGYCRNLNTTIKRYTSPEKAIPGRAEQVKQAVAYIREHGHDANFSPLDRYVIERFCFSILSRRPATQKIAAVHSTLCSFGAEFTPEQFEEVSSGISE